MGWVDERGYLLRALAVESVSKGVAVRAEFVHALPVGLMQNVGLAEYGIVEDDELLGAIKAAEEGGGADLRARGMGDNEALRSVAFIYLLAVGRGRPPAEEVARFLVCSMAGAGKWIAAAKERGHLKVTTGRR
jgi:hypothetical protein